MTSPAQVEPESTQDVRGIRRPLRVMLLLTVWIIMGAGLAKAEVIIVGGSKSCNFEQAIISHNKRASAFGSECKAGDGNDVIKIKPTVTTISFPSPPPVVENGSLEIEADNESGCSEVEGVAYLTLSPGTHVTLSGVGLVADGSRPLSVIDNNGGTLEIRSKERCAALFSNVGGRGQKPNTGGILFNRNGAKSRISGARFENSAAASQGGAIFIDSGAVTVDEVLSFETSSFTNNSANEGGAIYVNRGAALLISSNNFSFANNQALGGNGGAVYNNGGTVVIQPAAASLSAPLEGAMFSSNTARLGFGGAIYSDGGVLRADGIRIKANAAGGNGGGIAVANMAAKTPASITRSIFDGNFSESNGGAIYSTGRSSLYVSQTTFEHDRSVAQRGAIYVDSFGSVNVDNSTFVGTGGSGSDPEGIAVTAGGTAEIAFTTFYSASLGTGLETLDLRDSILQMVTCQAGSVFDATGNIKFQTSGCPGSIPTANPDLDPFLLQDNGGATPTIALLPESPAINQIKPANCVNSFGARNQIDQRGYSRPAPPSGNCDIGAFEFGASPAPGAHRPHNTRSTSNGIAR